MAISGVGVPAASRGGVFPYEVHETTLANGLSVVTIPMPSPGLVSWAVWVHAGSRDEVDPGRTGFAHFFEHLMFEGTPTTPGTAREALLVRLGAEDNAWTWFDETVYHTTLPATGLPQLVPVEADRFANLELREETVRREAGAVYGEFRTAQSDPDAALDTALQATAFTTHPYHHTTIGLQADIMAMPTARDHGVVFFARHYRPDNVRVIVAGDVDPDAVTSLVEAHFGAWTVPDVAIPPIPPEPPQTEPRTVHVPWPTPTPSRLTMAWRIPPSNPDDPTVAALQLAEDVLFGPAGPLERRLIREEGLALEVWGGRDDFVDPSLFRISVRLAEPYDIDAAASVIQEVLADLADGVDPTVVTRARSHARTAFLISLDDPATVASAFGWAARRGGADAIDRFYAVYDAVTPADLSRVAAATFVDDQRIVATLATEAE